MLRTFVVIIVMVWVIKELIVGNLSMIIIEEIVKCLEILALQIEEDIMKGRQEKEDLMRKEDRPCVISVTMLVPQLRIFMNLMITRILEVKLQYVSCATTSDIQQSIVDRIETSQIEGEMKENSKIEGMMEETSKMIEGTMKGTLELRKTLRNKEMQSGNFEKNSMRNF